LVRFWLLTLGAVFGVAVTFSLGMWQWGRAHEKLALQAQQQARQALPALGQDTLRVAPRSPDLTHRTVLLRGQWLAAHTVYLDNRQMQGRVGFYVITPLRLSPDFAGAPDAVVLVQRGWVPRSFTDRQQLPAITTPSGDVTVSGRIAPAPSKLYAFEGADTGSIRQISIRWLSVPRPVCRCSRARCSKPAHRPRACFATGRCPRAAPTRTTAMPFSGGRFAA
jgi:surfeit locus 1 family protein